MSGAELSERIDSILVDLRGNVGSLPGKQHQHIYEADDGKWVRVGMSHFEAYEVERTLFGEEVARSNYAEMNR